MSISDMSTNFDRCDMNPNSTLYDHLQKTSMLMDDGNRRLFERFDLTPPRFYALYHIGEEPGMSVKQLSQKMFCDRSNASRIVRGLATKGFVTRETHESDARVLRLYLTEQGQSICATAELALQSYNNTRLSSIPEEAKAVLLEKIPVLNKVLQGDLLHSK